MYNLYRRPRSFFSTMLFTFTKTLCRFLSKTAYSPETETEREREREREQGYAFYASCLISPSVRSHALIPQKIPRFSVRQSLRSWPSVRYQDWKQTIPLPPPPFIPVLPPPPPPPSPPSTLSPFFPTNRTSEHVRPHYATILECGQYSFSAACVEYIANADVIAQSLGGVTLFDSSR